MGAESLLMMPHGKRKIKHSVGTTFDSCSVMEGRRRVSSLSDMKQSVWLQIFLFAVDQADPYASHDLMIFPRGSQSLFGIPWTVYKAAHVISEGKIFWNTSPWSKIEPGPQGGQTVSYSTELAWPGPQEGQTVGYPTELSWLNADMNTI